MKLALVNGQRQEAQPDLSGECPGCGSPVIARCGEVRMWHWAHRGRADCDRWWEPETEWHRDWKNQFPVDWQEFVQEADDGERHRADVRTVSGWAIEFQHSYLKPEERRSREAFYKKLVWVVNGLRRARDSSQFRRAWADGRPVGTSVRSTFLDECRLLREWAGSPAPVFVDFGKEQSLAWLLTGRSNGLAYITALPREQFIAIHRGTATQDFDAFVTELPGLIANYESGRRAQESMRFSFDPLRVRGSTPRGRL